MLPRSAIGLLLGLAALAQPAASQSSDVIGHVLDRRTRQPVVEAVVLLTGTSHETVTDGEGAFKLTDVRSGEYTLLVRHIAYGEGSVQVTVVSGRPTEVVVAVAESAVELEPVTAEVFSYRELRQRGAGYRRDVVTREQIALAENTMMTMEDVLRQFVPSVRVRRIEHVAGTPVCIELRTIRVMGLANECLSPKVYLDGVPITNPTFLYGTLDPRMIERMEVLPAAEAGVRFGSGALYGALLIQTRRPDAAAVDPMAVRAERFDWTTEPVSHPTARVFLSSLIGNAGGLGLGLLAANQCLHLREPSYDSVVTDCETLPTVGAAAAALILPALGGSLASGFAGRTDLSKGRLLPATVGAGMALLPGYALVISSRRNDSDGLEWMGYALIVLGAPIASTAADYLFRKLRGSDDPH